MAATRSIIPQRTWQAIRKRAEAGENMTRLAAEYGIKHNTVQARSKLDKWRTPARRRKEGERITISEYDDTSGARSEALQQPLLQSKSSAMPPAGDSMPDLLAAIESGDLEAMQVAVRKVGQGMLREGLVSMGPPQSAREWDTWYNIVRKAAGLDGRGPAPGTLRLHAPRSIGRPAAIRPPAPAQAFDIE